ncbi:Arsenite-resistance protein 2 [Cooperia oncophora]
MVTLSTPMKMQCLTGVVCCMYVASYHRSLAAQKMEQSLFQPSLIRSSSMDLTIAWRAALCRLYVTTRSEMAEDEKKDGDKEVEAFIQANTVELAQDKWLCPLSGKKFKGPDFIRKHLTSKHDEKLREVREEAIFYNNYLADPNRPANVEVKPSPAPPREEERREDRYRDRNERSDRGGGDRSYASSGDRRNRGYAGLTVWSASRNGVLRSHQNRHALSPLTETSMRSQLIELMSCS